MYSAIQYTVSMQPREIKLAKLTKVNAVYNSTCRRRQMTSESSSFFKKIITYKEFVIVSVFGTLHISDTGWPAAFMWVTKKPSPCFRQ